MLHSIAHMGKAVLCILAEHLQLQSGSQCMQIGDACKQQSTEKAVFLEADYWGGPLKSCRWQGKCLARKLATLPSHITQSLT